MKVFLLMSILSILSILTILYLTQKKNLVIITSVIHTINAPLSYGPRSVISEQDRFDQTLLTIYSILKCVPNAYIVLVEGSDLTSAEKDSFMKAGCHEIYNVSKGLKDIINGAHKSVAEVHMILDYISTLSDIGRYATLSKISGRYYLTNKFNWNRYPRTKTLYQCDKRPQCHTRYYRIPAKYFRIYKSTLEAALNTPDFAEGKIDIETYNIYRDMPDAVKLMINEDEPLGVKGFIATFGYLVENYRN